MKKIYENAPQIAKEFFALTEVITEYGNDNGINSKIKELLLVGMFTAADGYRGIETHTKRAIQAGATKEELIATILYAIPVVGISKVNMALQKALEVLEEGKNYENS